MDRICSLAAAPAAQQQPRAQSTTGPAPAPALAAAAASLNALLLPQPVRRSRLTPPPEAADLAASRRALSGTRTPPFVVDVPHSPTSGKVPESLPVWWLVFVSLYYLPIILSWQLLGAIMLPASIAEIVPHDERNAKLALAAALGSLMQFAQPFVGAWSDSLSEGCGCGILGRRRPFLIVGQLVSCLGCAILMKCTDLGYWAAAVGYTLYMLGNAVGYGVYPSLIANHIPEHQRGTASGLQGGMTLLGLLGAAGLGVIAGDANPQLKDGSSSDADASGSGSDDVGNTMNEEIYAFLIVLNALCMVVAVISFGDRPTLALTPEATVPSSGSGAKQQKTEASAPLATFSDHLTLTLSPMPPPPSRCERICSFSFFSAFGHRSFSMLFVVFICASFGQFASMTYLQYFFRDLVAPDFTVFGSSLTIDAEAATGIWSLVQALTSFTVVVPAGVYSDKIGRKTLLGISFIITGCSFIPFALPNPRFELLLLMAAVGGVGGGINMGVQMALFADVLPSPDNAARDINLLVSSMTVSQTVVSYVGGSVLTWLEGQGEDTSKAYSTIWIGAIAINCLGEIFAQYLGTVLTHFRPFGD